MPHIKLPFMPTPKKVKADEYKRISDMLRELCGKRSMTENVKRLKEHCKELYRCGWKKLVLNYSGSGDSCDDFSMTISNAEDEFNFLEIANPPPETRKEIENDLWDLLPAGFENNEGGSGTVTINTKTGKITVEHDQYYTESTHTKEVY